MRRGDTDTVDLELVAIAPFSLALRLIPSGSRGQRVENIGQGNIEMNQLARQQGEDICRPSTWTAQQPAVLGNAY